MHFLPSIIVAASLPTFSISINISELILSAIVCCMLKQSNRKKNVNFVGNLWETHTY